MLKVAGWLGLALAGMLFPLAVLAAYDVTGSSPPAPFHTGSSEGTATTVDIRPDTLNLRSNDRWVTAYIELPQGYDAGNIDVLTVRLCLGQVTVCPNDASVPAAEHPTAVGDHDGDTVPDRMMKFDRQALADLLAGQTGDVTMTVSGMVTPPGQPFAGSDTIRVIDHGCGGRADEAPCEGEDTREATPSPEPTPTPEAAPLPEVTAPPEATAPPPEPIPAGPTFEYVVQPGDTLFDIALRFGTGTQVLTQLNGLSSAQVVWVGQVLSVPGTAPPPVAAPPPPPPPDIPTVEYIVRPGERVADVAAFFGTTVDVVVALNGLTNPNLVVPGQRLLVPAPPAAASAAAPVFTSEYVVQPGENLTDIAARFGTTVEALAAANSLANPSAIRIGDRLLVP